MSAEDRALQAISITRSILERTLLKPEVLVQMMAWDVEPDDLEFQIDEILKYLDRTREEKGPVREDTSKILDIAERYIYRPTDFEEYNKELREKGFKERTLPEAKQGER